MIKTAKPMQQRRADIIVTGANGTLGQAVLRAIGPERAIAVTRHEVSPLAGFRHFRLDKTGGVAPEILATSFALINAAGRVDGTTDELYQTNVALAAALAHQARDAGLSKFVQVGSFSVYGYADMINAAVAIAPVTVYGQSKAMADERLFALMGPDFAVESVHLPFLFSQAQPALLGPLIALGRHTRVLPAGRPPMQRSMLVYDDAAQLLVAAATSQRRGPTHVADPQRFDYALLCRLVFEERGQRWRIAALPAFVVSAISRCAPRIGRRLFRSSVLAPEANQAGANPLNLERELRAIIRAAIPKR